MRRTFRSLSSHNYRLWFFAALVSNVGAWMQATAQNWVVLTELTDGDAIAVGAMMAFQLVPQLFLAPVAGLIADRIDRRALLVCSQLAMTVLTILIGVLLASGNAELWHFFLFAIVFGLINALDAPARNTFVSDLVGDQLLSNAVSLNLASHHAARLVGPAMAGIVIAVFGSGWVFIINSVTFLPLIGLHLVIIITGLVFLRSAKRAATAE